MHGRPGWEASFWAPDLTEGARNRKNTWIDQAPRRTEVEERRYVRRSHHVVGVPALDEEARLPAGAARGQALRPVDVAERVAGQAVGRVRVVVQEEGVVSGRAVEKREMLRGPLCRRDVALQDAGVLPEAVDLWEENATGER